jgi:hypothetical protein
LVHPHLTMNRQTQQFRVKNSACSPSKSITSWLLELTAMNKAVRCQNCSVNTIWVKRAPKPVPVKRRPLTACRFLFHGICRASGLYICHIPLPGQRLLLHLWSQPTVDIHHAALSSLLRPLRLLPWVSIPSFPRVSPVFTSGIMQLIP